MVIEGQVEGEDIDFRFIKNVKEVFFSVFSYQVL